MDPFLIKVVSEAISISPESVLPSLGPGNPNSWDSLAHITIVTACEAKYSVMFGMSEIMEIKSLDDLIQLLIKHGVSIP